MCRKLNSDPSFPSFLQMGIRGLHPFIRRHAPHVYKKVPLAHYAGKRVAVDISGLIYKYKILNKDRWLDSFAYLIFALRRNQIHPIFVYDGEAPPEKDEEKSRRSAQRRKMADHVFAIREALDQFYQNGEVADVLMEEMKKVKAPPALGKVAGINTAALEKRYDQLESQVVHFKEEEISMLNELFDLCGIQHIVSPSEAETFCASLALSGQVEGVISNDSDVIAYGVGKFLYEINWATSDCTEIDHKELCEALSLTPDQLLDFCILCGNDYNDNIRGIGPETAYKLIRAHGSIEKIPIDTSGLDYLRGRELFRIRHNYPCEILSINPGTVNEIANFLRLRNSRIKRETIENAFRQVEIIFDD